jgi:hypothetical protein
MTPRSGVKSITQLDMIWRRAELIWIARRCKTSRWCRSRSEEIIIGPILTMMNNLTRSMSSSRAAYQSPPRFKERSSSKKSIWLNELSLGEE